MKNSVPKGWKKGERIVIESREIQNSKTAWFVKRDLGSYDLLCEIGPYDISEIWFYSFEEFAQFIEWWFSK